jgi:hypothetical protein
MPNHCANTLTIFGPKADLRKFIDGIVKIDDGDVNDYVSPPVKILDSYYPIPQELKDVSTAHCSAEPEPHWAVMLADGSLTQERYDELVANNAENYRKRQENIARFGYADWYEWANTNWGTKWGDYDGVVRFVDDDEVKIIFTSAWGPPVEGLRHVSGMFPTLSFVLTYDEPGMGFLGASSFRNGVTVFDVTEDAPEFPGGADEDDAWESFYEETQDALTLLAVRASSALGPVSAL